MSTGFNVNSGGGGDYLRSAGVRFTLSGETWVRPNFRSTSLFWRSWATSYGECPFNESRIVLLMWFIISRTSSFVSSCILRPLGIMYLMYSWFFSNLPFWLECIGSQKKILVRGSPSIVFSNLMTFLNSEPLSVSMTGNVCLKMLKPNNLVSESNTERTSACRQRLSLKISIRLDDLKSIVRRQTPECLLPFTVSISTISALGFSLIYAWKSR